MPGPEAGRGGRWGAAALGAAALGSVVVVAASGRQRASSPSRLDQTARTFLAATVARAASTTRSSSFFMLEGTRGTPEPAR